MKKLKIKPIIALISLVVLGIVGGTVAYFYQEVAIPNSFKTKTYNVTIEEEFDGDFGDKKVYIVNSEDTNADVVLRVSYNELWSTTSGDYLLTLSNKINGSDAVTKTWTDTWTDNFIDGGDGWYYYTKVLSAGSRIQILESIEKNTTLISTSDYKDEYDTYDYELSFNAETIQATEDAVKSIWNKTITINGENVSWS